MPTCVIVAGELLVDMFVASRIVLVCVAGQSWVHNLLKTVDAYRVVANVGKATQVHEQTLARRALASQPLDLTTCQV